MKKVCLPVIFTLLLLMGCGKKNIPDTKAPPTTKEVEEPALPGLSPAYGDTLIESYIADAVSLNPVLICDVPSRQIVSLIYNGLVREDGDLSIVPDLAKEWEVMDNGKTYRFHLHRGVKWHDGVEFSAADVLFTYQMIMDEKNQSYLRNQFNLVETVEVEDPYTVAVSYTESYAPAIYGWTSGIIPKHVFSQEQDLNKSHYNRAPIGTGPFKIVQWTPAEQIILEVNEDYFGGRPYFDTYIYKVIPEPSMSFLALQRGDLDMMELTPDQFKKKTGNSTFLSRFNVLRMPSRLYTYFGFNLLNPLFDDKKVRLALTMATDRQKIIDEILYGYGKTLTGPFPPSFWCYDKSIPPVKYNPEQAKELLAEAGWTDTDGDGIVDKNGKPFEFNLSTNNGNEMRRLTASLIQKLWKDIGVKVTLNIVEWGVLMDLCDYKTFDALIMGWSHNGDPDPYARFHSSEIPDKSKGIVADNFCSFINSEADRLLVEGRTTIDREKRKEIYHKFHRLIYEEMPYIFLYSNDYLYAAHNRIHGIIPAASGIKYNLSKWYVPKELQKY